MRDKTRKYGLQLGEWSLITSPQRHRGITYSPFFVQRLPHYSFCEFLPSVGPKIVGSSHFNEQKYAFTR